MHNQNTGGAKRQRLAADDVVQTKIERMNSKMKASKSPAEPQDDVKIEEDQDEEPPASHTQVDPLPQSTVQEDIVVQYTDNKLDTDIKFPINGMIIHLKAPRGHEKPIKSKKVVNRLASKIKELELGKGKTVTKSK